ncbi:MAG: hypothetical protein ACI9MC_003186, partial [Kiritimatiellia bacterium]
MSVRPIKYLTVLTFLGACTSAQDTDSIVLDDPIELPVPDLSGVDLQQVF